MDHILEICCFNTESFLNAQKGGADRIELCDNIREGGTTPSYGMIKQARKLLFIDLFVIIRPRGGDFLYSQDEFDIMKENIQMAKQLHANGIVSGILNENGTVDIERTGELVELARPLPFTFHRAIDMCKDQFAALEDIISTGAKRILTSGGKKNALEGINKIKEMIRRTDNRIIIMPGAGIDESNINAVRNISKASEYHSTAKVLRKSKMKYRNLNLTMSNDTLSENTPYITDVEKVSKMKSILNSES